MCCWRSPTPTDPQPGQLTAAAERSAHVFSDAAPAHLAPWAAEASGSRVARPPLSASVQAALDGAAAWRRAAQAADEALERAADIAQGLEPGSKREAHAAATAAEDAALIACAAYDREAGTSTDRSTT